MIIIVKSYTGKNIEVEVEPRDTIEILKEKISLKEAIFPVNQTLMFNGRILEDEKWLYDYNITEKNTIYLSIKIRGHEPRPIFIKHSCYMTEIKICFCHKLEQLKEYIQREIDFYSKNQKLYFNGKILDDSEKNLYDLGIRELSIIDLDGVIDNCDYKKKFKNELIQLKDMGFYSEEKNIQILRVSSGNIRYAIQHYYKYLK